MGDMEFGGAREDSEQEDMVRGDCLRSPGLVGVDGNRLGRPGCGRAGRPQGRAGHSQYLPGVPGSRLKVRAGQPPRGRPCLGPNCSGQRPGRSVPGPEAAFPLAFCKTQVRWS